MQLVSLQPLMDLDNLLTWLPKPYKQDYQFNNCNEGIQISHRNADLCTLLARGFKFKQTRDKQRFKPVVPQMFVLPINSLKKKM